MFLNITASKDTYVHNKIINNSFRAQDSNVGYAGTLDLFKFYGEAQLPKLEKAEGSAGTYNLDADADGYPETSIELSRILMYFDLSDVEDYLASELDIVNDTSFYCELKLFDILDGQMAPTNFSVNVFPLAASFPEGVGRDTGAFSDLDIPNWLTASYNGAANPPEIEWKSSDGGCGTVGSYAGDGNPVIVDAYQFLEDGVTDISSTKEFVEGTESFTFDVTAAVREMLKGTIENNGFRISFSQIEESDTRTYFLKRFASRHVLNQYLRPRLTVAWNNSFRDNSKNAELGISNTFILSNINRGTPINSSYENGEDKLTLTISTGSYDKSYDVSRVYAAYPAIGSSASVVNKEGFYYAVIDDQDLASDAEGARIVTSTSEIIRVELADHNTTTENLDGKYFSVFSTTTEYYCWFNVDTGLEEDPEKPGATAIEISVVEGQSAEEIARTTATAISAIEGLSADVYSLGVVHLSIDVHGPPAATAGVGTITDENFAVEVYQAGTEVTIKDHVISSGSVTFKSVWSGVDDEDNSVTLKSGTIKFSPAEQSAFSATSRNLDLNLINAKSSYKTSERAKFRIFARDPLQESTATRVPVKAESLILDEVYYRVRDAISNDIIVPFESDNGGTRLSTDSDGMYFDVIMSSLFPGRSYTVDLKIIERGNESVIELKEIRFRVDK